MSSPRILLLLAKRRPPDLEARIARGEEPRVEYLELQRALGAKLLDFDDVERSRNPLVRALTRRMGLAWGLAALGTQLQGEFDHVYCTGEDVALPLAIMNKGLRVREKLTAVIHNADTPKRRALFRVLGDRPFRHIIVLGGPLREILVDELRMPAAKVHRLNNWLDQHYFTPAGAPSSEGDYALSIGMEQRDYPTLQAAAAGLPYRFHVVASGWSPGTGYGTAGGITAGGNIEVGRGYSTEKLRALYAGARFVIVPLKRATYAAGVTGILEGMGVGKAVITSASPGVRDYVRDGESGTCVPVGDAAALRQAIVQLWDDSDRRAKMGAHNRAWVERELNTDRYVESVQRLFA